MECTVVITPIKGRTIIGALIGLLSLSLIATVAPAQTIPQPSPQATNHAAEVRLPQLKRRTQQEISNLVEGLSQVDAELKLVVGQARLLRLKRRLAQAEQQASISVADPTVLDLKPLADGRSLRLLGLRPGSTEFTLTLGDESHYGFRVDVTYDLAFLNRRLEQLFPTARIQATQLKDHLVLEGQARSISQVSDVIRTTEAYLAAAVSTIQAPAAAGVADGQAAGAAAASPAAAATVPAPQIINLLRIPESPQVLLKVQVAELNRTTLRRIGTDLLFSHGGQTLGTQIGGAVTVQGSATGDATSLVSLITGTSGGNATSFAIFESINTQFFFTALRQNGILNVLAEPNLVAMTGHQASFLAGGEFPIPVAQGGASNAVSVEFRPFGVRLEFTPSDTGLNGVRLAVRSEVSSIDQSIGTTLVAGGDPVPGLSSRTVETTVEIPEGNTLLMAGLLQITLDGSTQRIPGLGDLPTIGPFFRNTSGRRQEKELIVLVTPTYVESTEADRAPPIPGALFQEPDDDELYRQGKLIGEKFQSFRSTEDLNREMSIRELLNLERDFVRGPIGFSQ